MDSILLDVDKRIANDELRILPVEEELMPHMNRCIRHHNFFVIQYTIIKVHNSRLEVLAPNERDCFCAWWRGSAKVVMIVGTMNPLRCLTKHR